MPPAREAHAPGPHPRAQHHRPHASRPGAATRSDITAAAIQRSTPARLTGPVLPAAARSGHDTPRASACAGASTAAAEGEQASRSVPSTLSLRTTIGERRGRGLLLGKGAVLAHRLARRSLLSRTTTSSHPAGLCAIATRDCASWRGISRVIACASKEHSRRGRAAACVSVDMHAADRRRDPGALSSTTTSAAAVGRVATTRDSGHRG
jgi:hypothetical protein